jgi:fucose permease
MAVPATIGDDEALFMGRIFVLALTAALNPTLVTATTVMLLLPNPKRLMVGYLAGAYTTGIIVGLAIVEWLHNSGAVSETKHTVAPGSILRSAPSR